MRIWYAVLINWAFWLAKEARNDSTVLNLEYIQKNNVKDTRKSWSKTLEVKGHPTNIYLIPSWISIKMKYEIYKKRGKISKCLLTVNSSFVNFLSVSLTYFSVGVFICILLNRQLSLYIKDTSPLSAIYTANAFL